MEHDDPNDFWRYGECLGYPRDVSQSFEFSVVFYTDSVITVVVMQQVLSSSPVCMECSLEPVSCLSESCLPHALITGVVRRASDWYIRTRITCSDTE